MPSLDEQLRNALVVHKQQSDSPHKNSKSDNKSILHANLDFIRGDPEQFSSSSNVLKNKNIIRLSQNANPAVAKAEFRLPSKTASPSTAKKPEDVPEPKFDLFPQHLDISWKTCREIGGGLHNQGNTCYLNSVLQCLTYTAPLTNVLLDGNHAYTCKVQNQFCMLCELQRNTKRIFEHSKSAISPMTIVHRIRDIGRCFHPGRQEDAHEFIVHLFDSIQKSCLYGRPKLDNFTQSTTLLHKIFGGFCRSQVICGRCSTRSNTFDPFLTVSIDVKQCNSIDGSLKHYTKTESLGNENMYKCEKCKQKVQAQRRVTFHRLPMCFIFHLKRFNYNGFNMKLSKQVEYPERLNLAPYVSDTVNGVDSKVFNLYGVLVHSGYSSHSGHYYCYVKSPSGAWYKCNDSQVSRVGLNQVLQQEAYLLFYSRQQSSKLQNSHKPNGLVSHTKSPNLLLSASPKQQPIPFIGPQKVSPSPQKPQNGNASPISVPNNQKSNSQFKIPRVQSPTHESVAKKPSSPPPPAVNQPQISTTPVEQKPRSGPIVPYSPGASDEDDEEKPSSPKVLKLDVAAAPKVEKVTCVNSSWEVQKHPPPSSPSHSNCSVSSTDHGWRVSDANGNPLDSDLDISCAGTDLDSLVRRRGISECKDDSSHESPTFVFPRPAPLDSTSSVESTSTVEPSPAQQVQKSSKLAASAGNYDSESEESSNGSSGKMKGLGLFKFKQSIKGSLHRANVKVDQMENSRYNGINRTDSITKPSSKLTSHDNSYGRHDFSDHNYVQQRPPPPTNEGTDARKRKYESFNPRTEERRVEFNPQTVGNANILTWDNSTSRTITPHSKFSHGSSNGNRTYDRFDEEIDRGKMKKIKQRDSFNHRNSYPNNQFQKQYERNHMNGSRSYGGSQGNY